MQATTVENTQNQYITYDELAKRVASAEKDSKVAVSAALSKQSGLRGLRTMCHDKRPDAEKVGHLKDLARLHGLLGDGEELQRPDANEGRGHMIVLSFNVTIQSAGSKTHVAMTPIIVGDTPDEQDALKLLAQQTGEPGNPIQELILDLCAERGIRVE